MENCPKVVMMDNQLWNPEDLTIGKPRSKQPKEDGFELKLSGNIDDGYIYSDITDDDANLHGTGNNNR